MSSADDAGPQPTRRDVLERAGLAAGTTVALASGAQQVAPRYSPVGRASAQVTPIDKAKFTSGAYLLYEGVSSLWNSGYSEEDVDDITSENLHWSIYQSMETLQGLSDGFGAESANWVEPGNVDSGALASMVWGEIRAETLTSISDGAAVDDVTSAADTRAFDYLAKPEKNYIRQSNEFIFDVTRHLANFADVESGSWDEIDPETGTDDAPNHSEGEVYGESFGPVSMGPTSDGLAPKDVFFTATNSVDTSTPDELEVQIKEHECVNGDIEEYYDVVVRWDWVDPNSRTPWKLDPFRLQSAWNGIGAGPDGGNSSTESYYLLDATSPEGEQVELAHYENGTPFTELFGAIDEVAGQVESDLSDYVDSVYTAVSAGEIDPTKILAPTDYIDQFGDSDDVTRLHAELVGLGLSAPGDNGAMVTISADNDTLEGEATGRLYLDWSWNSLSSWEYAYDPTTGELVIDSDSFMPGSVYEATFESDSIAIDAEDGLEETDSGYLYVFSDSELDGLGNLQSISVDPAGELNSFIPAGETVSGDASHTILVTDEGDRYSFSESDEFTVESIESDGDSLDRYQITGFEQTTRDPARAIEQAAWYSDQRQTTEDIDEDGGGGDGGWGLPNFGGFGGGSGLLGLGIIAAAGAVAVGYVTRGN